MLWLPVVCKHSDECHSSFLTHVRSSPDLFYPLQEKLYPNTVISSALASLLCSHPLLKSREQEMEQWRQGGGKGGQALLPSTA